MLSVCNKFIVYPIELLYVQSAQCSIFSNDKTLTSIQNNNPNISSFFCNLMILIYKNCERNEIFNIYLSQVVYAREDVEIDITPLVRNWIHSNSEGQLVLSVKLLNGHMFRHKEKVIYL